MGRYLTRDELYALRGEERVLHLAGGAGEPDLVGLDAALAAAEAEADSYLLPRYRTVLPATPEAAPQLLKDKVADLTLHKLAARWDQVSQPVREAYLDAVRWLQAVGRGAADLGLAGPPAADVTTPAILSTKRAADAALTLAKLEDW